jgi:hypothetical protein
MPEASVIHQGEYRASDKNRKWRIVQKRGGVGVESELNEPDAMGKTVFSTVKAFEVNGAATTILVHLVNLAKKGEKLPRPDKRPAILASGEVPQANTEKPKLQWRIVLTERGNIVAEEEKRRDLLGEVVFGSAGFDSQCSVEKAIFDHLLAIVYNN